MRRAAVGTHQIGGGSPAVLQGDVAKPGIVGRVGRPEDNADVHHDVDEQRIRSHEGSQVTALLPAQRQRSACFDQDVAQALVPGQAVPAQVRGQEEEAEVMDVAIEPARLQWPRVVFRQRAPLGLAGLLVQEPKDAGKKAFAPGRPTLAFAVPAPLHGVHRRVARVSRDNAASLARGELQRPVQIRKQVFAKRARRVRHDCLFRVQRHGFTDSCTLVCALSRDKKRCWQMPKFPGIAR